MQEWLRNPLKTSLNPVDKFGWKLQSEVGYRTKELWEESKS